MIALIVFQCIVVTRRDRFGLSSVFVNGRIWVLCLFTELWKWKNGCSVLRLPPPIRVVEEHVYLREVVFKDNLEYVC